MENTEIKQVAQIGYISDDIRVSGILVQTAQKTLSDLDRSILELSALVDSLKDQSKKLIMRAV